MKKLIPIGKWILLAICIGVPIAWISAAILGKARLSAPLDSVASILVAACIGYFATKMAAKKKNKTLTK